MQYLRNVIGVMAVAVVLPGCWYYSFSGASIPAHLQTLAIPLFEDQSRSGQPNLAETLTENLIDRFVRQTRFALADEPEADALLQGQISQYRNAPASVTGQERAALNRITITVSARYYDQKQTTELMPQRTFSAFAEYDPAEGLDQEAAAIEDALAQIAGDIFSAATSNW